MVGEGAAAQGNGAKSPRNSPNPPLPSDLVQPVCRSSGQVPTKTTNASDEKSRIFPMSSGEGVKP